MAKKHSTSNSRRRERDSANPRGISTIRRSSSAIESEKQKEGNLSVNQTSLENTVHDLNKKEEGGITKRSENNLKKTNMKAHIKYSRVKRRVLKHVWPIRIFIILIGLLVVGGVIFGINILSQSLGVGKFISLASDFLHADTSRISSFEGNTNILLLGVGGEGHEGSTLTDTMLLISISLDKGGISVVSIPRDIWIPDLRAKINSAYYWGEEKNPGLGMTLARTAVESVSGVEVQYAALLDFNGFKRIIDELGGINVDVERGFTDPMFPIAGKENDLCGGDPLYKCRYESITFSEGIQFMDGETALKFVRSRHAEGDEGTDFARSARQQKVIEGIKQKALTKEILFKPGKISALWRVVNESINTDLQSHETAIIARKVYDSKDMIKNNSIPEDLLENPPISRTYDRLYVFIPKAGNGNWTEIHDWFNKTLP